MSMAITISRSNSGTDFTLYLTGVDGEYTHPILASMGNGKYYIFPNMRHIETPKDALTAEELVAALESKMEEFFGMFAPQERKTVVYSTAPAPGAVKQEKVEAPSETIKEEKTKISMDDF